MNVQKKGMTLVEIILTLAILSLVSLPILQLFIYAQNLTQQTELTDLYVNEVENIIQKIKSNQAEIHSTEMFFYYKPNGEVYFSIEASKETIPYGGHALNSYTLRVYENEKGAYIYETTFQKAHFTHDARP